MTVRNRRVWVSMLLALLAVLLVGVVPAAADTASSAAPEVQVLAQDGLPESPSGLWEMMGLQHEERDAHQALLPAWRWRGGTGWAYGSFNVDGAFGIASQLMSLLASILFTVAHFFWAMLLLVFRLVLSTDLAYTAHGLINGMYTLLADAILGGTLLVIPVVGILWFGFRAALRGDSMRVVRMIVVFVLAIGAMQGLTQTIAAGGAGESLNIGEDTRAYTPEEQERLEERFGAYVEHVAERPPTFSPGWFAIEGQTLADSLGRQLVEPFVGIGSDALGVTAYPDEAEADTSTSCAAYVRTLYTTYGVARGDADGSSFSGTSPVGGMLSDNTKTMMSSLSRLWELGYLPYWQQAHFSDSKAGNSASCQLAELRSNVPPRWREATAAVAGFPASTSGTEGTYRRTNQSYKQVTPTIMPFLMCRVEPNGQAYPRKEFYGFARNMTGKRLGDTDDCNTHFLDDDDYGDNGSSNFNPFTAAEVSGAEYATGTVEGTHGHPDDVGAAYDAGRTALPVLEAWVGQNPTERLFFGLMALIVAWSFMWAFGRMAIGLLGVQLALIGLLACLPVTLLSLAIPSGKNGASGGQKFGVKMLKMTGGMFISKAVYTVMLTAAFVAIFLVRNLVDMAFGTDNVLASGTVVAAGFGNLGRDLLMAAAPLLVLHGMRKLMAAMRLGDITKFSGALATPMALGLKAVGEDRAATRVQDGYKGLDRAAEKTKSAAKSAAKLAGKGAMVAGVATAGVAAGKWWQAAGEDGTGTDGHATKQRQIKDMLNTKFGSTVEKGKEGMRYARRAALAWQVLGRGGVKPSEVGKQMDRIRRVEAGAEGGMLSTFFGTGSGGVNPEGVTKADAERSKEVLAHTTEFGPDEQQASTLQRSLGMAQTADERASRVAELHQDVSEGLTGHKDPVLLDDGQLAAQRRAHFEAITGLTGGKVSDETIAEFMVDNRGPLGPLPDPRKSAQDWTDAFGADVGAQVSSLDYFSVFDKAGSDIGAALRDALEVSPEMFGDLVLTASAFSGTLQTSADHGRVFAAAPGRMDQLDGGVLDAIRTFAQENQSQRETMASYVTMAAAKAASDTVAHVRTVNDAGTADAVRVAPDTVQAAAQTVGSVEAPDMESFWTSAQNTLTKHVDQLDRTLTELGRRGDGTGDTDIELGKQAARRIDQALVGPIGDLVQELRNDPQGRQLAADLQQTLAGLSKDLQQHGTRAQGPQLDTLRTLLDDHATREAARNEAAQQRHLQELSRLSDQSRETFTRALEDMRALHDTNAEVRLAEAALDPNFDGNTKAIVDALERQAEKQEKQLTQLHERYLKAVEQGRDAAAQRSLEQLVGALQQTTSTVSDEFGRSVDKLGQIEARRQRQVEAAQVVEARRTNVKGNLEAAREIDRMRRSLEASAHAGAAAGAANGTRATVGV